MTKDVNLVELDYFKPSGKYYSSGYFEAPEGALLDEVCQMVKERMLARNLPGLAGGHSLFDVVVTYKGVPALIRAAAQAADVSYLIRDLDIIRVILESSTGAISADFQRIDRLQDFIRRAAPQSPAVAQEVVEKLRQIERGTGTKDGQFQRSLIMSKDTMRELASDCLALLVGKES